MVDKGEKLLELAYTTLLELSIKNLFSSCTNAVLTRFPWNKSNASATRPPCCCGEEALSVVDKTFWLLLLLWALRVTKLSGKKEEGEGRLWRALQIGTALSAAFHGFLESFQKSLSFVRDELSFMLFQAIFGSLWKLLFSFPEAESIDTDVSFLWIYLALVASCRVQPFFLPFLPSSCHLGGSQHAQGSSYVLFPH